MTGFGRCWSPKNHGSPHETGLSDAGPHLFPIGGYERWRPELAHKILAGHRAFRCRQFHRHYPARCVRAALTAIRSDHCRGKPRRRRRHSRRGVCRQIGAGWSHDPGERSRPHDRAGPLSEADLPSRPRFCSGRAVRHFTERARRFACERSQNRWRPRRRGKRPARHLYLFFRRRRKRDAFECGAFPVQRRNNRHPRAFQRRGRGHD